MCAFLRAAGKTKKRYPNQTKAEPKKTTKNEHASNTTKHQNTLQKFIKKSSKMAPRRGFWGVREPLGRRVGAKSLPKSTSEASGAPKKNFGRGRGRPKEISQPFFAPLKTDTHPGRGGHAVQRTLVLEHFPSRTLLAPRRGAKIEGSRVWGATLGAGGRS